MWINVHNNNYSSRLNEQNMQIMFLFMSKHNIFSIQMLYNMCIAQERGYLSTTDSKISARFGIVFRQLVLL